MTDEQTETKKTFKEKFGKFHDKYYKHLLLVPIIMLLFSLGYLYVFYSNNNDFIYKDISLTGGTSVTIYGDFDSGRIKADLSGKLEEINTREIYDILTREKIALVIETKTLGDETKQVIEDYLGYELNDGNSSFEFTGSLLSESFYKQLLTAILFAFVFMGIVIFLICRNMVPAIAVIISAFADILMTLVVVDLLGIKISSAGIVAFLMLIGYSVDTDILLTNKVLKSSEGTLNGRIFKAFKTGMTMALTSMTAVVIALIVSNPFSVVLSQIFTVLLIGLFFDIFNTWITNVSLIKWYVKKNEH
ncbi:protein translocase subunit SecF [Candidatus Pacearchaeota archaeon]|nr:protein translocase subunit SecF [Candidatus Pacearchaeota archaeon]